MTKLATLLVVITITAVTVASPKLGLICALVAFAALVVMFWLMTIAELLRAGPGAERDRWIASLAVVVLLGPLGALAYRLAASSFDRQDTESAR